MTAIALQHRELIIEQIANGKRLADIAPSLGVSPQAISRALHQDQEYRDAIEQGFHTKLDQAEDMIIHASDNVDVARARALWSATAWRAEREFPSKWAQKQEVTHTASGPLISITLAGQPQIAVDNSIDATHQRIESD